MRLQGVGFHPIDMSLVPDEISKLPRARRRLTEVLVKGSTTSTAPDAAAARASWSLDFRLAPAAFLGDAAGRVRAGVFARTELAAPFDPASPVAVSRAASSEPVEIPAQLAFRSVGYQSAPLPGFADARIPFDDAGGVIRHDARGRVLRATTKEEEEEAAGAATATLPGVYCAGWVKRGPTGVIASTMEDAFATGDAIAEDWGAAFLPGSTAAAAGGWEALRAELGFAAGADACRVVSWDGWRKIDAAERERGRAVGKEREKFTSTREMLAVL